MGSGSAQNYHLMMFKMLVYSVLTVMVLRMCSTAERSFRFARIKGYDGKTCNESPTLVSHIGISLVSCAAVCMQTPGCVVIEYNADSQVCMGRTSMPSSPCISISGTKHFIMDFKIRLVDGLQPSEGRVEVYMGSSWGTVCDDSWNNVTATVVCRMFGFSGGFGIHAAYFGEGSGQILMDNVLCDGTETSLLDCSFQGLHNCLHSEDASVTCF